MAMYRCENCGEFVDNDWHPGVPFGFAELICPTCAEALGLDEDGNPTDIDYGEPTEAQEWHDYDPDC